MTNFGIKLFYAITILFVVALAVENCRRRLACEDRGGDYFRADWHVYGRCVKVEPR